MPGQKSSVLSRAARAWLGLLGFIAAVAQLISAPWPLWVRISIFAGLLLTGLLFVTYHVGVRHGSQALASSADKARTAQTPGQLASGWSSQKLSGRHFVKVASSGSSVTVCALHEDCSVEEHLLALSGNDAHQFLDRWSGSWFFTDDGLHILVAGHHLLMQPSLKGTWTGVEYFGYEEHQFIGAVIDHEPITAGQSWVALRLVSGSEKRRLLSADAGGSLQETDLYERSKGRKGTWEEGDRGVHLDTDGSTSFAESFWDGVLIAMDADREKCREFALVRIRVQP
jgi:hypothetical protein